METSNPFKGTINATTVPAGDIAYHESIKQQREVIASTLICYEAFCDTLKDAEQFRLDIAEKCAALNIVLPLNLSISFHHNEEFLSISRELRNLYSTLTNPAIIFTQSVMAVINKYKNFDFNLVYNQFAYYCTVGENLFHIYFESLSEKTRINSKLISLKNQLFALLREIENKSSKQTLESSNLKRDFLAYDFERRIWILGNEFNETFAKLEDAEKIENRIVQIEIEIDTIMHEIEDFSGLIAIQQCNIE